MLACDLLIRLFAQRKNIMKFNIYTGNHTPPRKHNSGNGVYDLVDWIVNTLVTNHEVNISNDISTIDHNIIIEGFDKEDDIHEILAAYDAGARFSVVLTENVTLDDNDLLRMHEIPFDQYNAYMPNAYFRFLNLAKLIDKITCFIVIDAVPSVMDYKAIFPTMKFSQFSVPPIKANTEEKHSEIEFDFCFFGSQTPHRKMAIKALRDEGLRVYSGTDIEGAERFKILQKSEFNLHIKPSPEWTDVSPMRIYSAAQAGKQTVHLTDDIGYQTSRSSLSTFTIFADLETIQSKNFQHNLSPLSNPAKQLSTIANSFVDIIENRRKGETSKPQLAIINFNGYSIYSDVGTYSVFKKNTEPKINHNKDNQRFVGSFVTLIEAVQSILSDDSESYQRFLNSFNRGELRQKFKKRVEQRVVNKKISSSANIITEQPPLFSVILPTRNRVDLLVDSVLPSILNQSFRSYEIVVCDNASSDDTKDVMKGLVEKYGGKIRYERSDAWIPKEKFFQWSMEKAKGKFLTLFFDDDVMCSRALEKVHDVLNLVPEADIISYSRALTYFYEDFPDPDRKNVMHVPPFSGNIYKYSSEEHLKAVFERNELFLPTPMVSNAFYRTDLINNLITKYGDLFPHGHMGDYNICCFTLSSTESFFYLDDPIAMFGQWSENTTAQLHDMETTMGEYDDWITEFTHTFLTRMPWKHYLWPNCVAAALNNTASILGKKLHVNSLSYHRSIKEEFAQFISKEQWQETLKIMARDLVLSAREQLSEQDLAIFLQNGTMKKAHSFVEGEQVGSLTNATEINFPKHRGHTINGEMRFKNIREAANYFEASTGEIQLQCVRLLAEQTQDLKQELQSHLLKFG
jgi:glycosyltransferase involved in cell wall biosynthesis